MSGLQRLELFAGVSSMEALIDELGLRFVNELDYTLEAGHAEEFNQAINARAITLSPTPYTQTPKPKP
jgi:predicted unusual protein kinase regulating ubiquinone biosynthesis (AarF/ABC1/UbiB family)